MGIASQTSTWSFTDISSWFPEISPLTLDEEREFKERQELLLANIDWALKNGSLESAYKEFGKGKANIVRFFTGSDHPKSELYQEKARYLRKAVTNLFQANFSERLERYQPV